MPRKQRKFRFTAPEHLLQHMAHAHLSKAAKEKYGLNIRSVEICKGDTVKILKGSNKDKVGKVKYVNLRRQYVFLDSLKTKNAKGKEMNVSVRISNLSITELNLSDKYRAKKLKLKQQVEVKEPEAKKEEVKEVEPAPEAEKATESAPKLADEKASEESDDSAEKKEVESLKNE